MATTSSPNATYRQTREQLIQLSVDLEDRAKVCMHLRAKAKEERARLGRMEADFERRFQAQAEEAAQRHRGLMEKLVADTNATLERKKSKVATCKALMDELTVGERAVATECAAVYAEADAAIERERKLWRAGHEERMQTYLQTKANECKESTQKALHGEFRKAEAALEQEMLDIDRRHKVDERRILDAFRDKFVHALAAEEAFLKDEAGRLARTLADANAAELADAEGTHRQLMQRIEADDDAGARAFAEGLRARAEADRRALTHDLAASQDAFQAKVKDMRVRNAGEISALKADHAAQCKALYLKFSRERDAQDAAWLKADEHEGGSRDIDEFKEGTEADGEDHHDGGEVAGERDRRLQTEIKHIQNEMVRFERDLKSKTESECVGIKSATAREEHALARARATLTEEIAVLALEREELARRLEAQAAQSNHAHRELAEVMREVDIYKGGIAVHRMRVRDIESLHGTAARDEDAGTRGALQRLQAEHAVAVDEARQLEAEHKAAATKLVNDREIMLDALDRQIKADVQQKEAELVALRDAIHAEEVKVARLETLLHRYRKVT